MFDNLDKMLEKLQNKVIDIYNSDISDDSKTELIGNLDATLSTILKDMSKDEYLQIHIINLIKLNLDKPLSDIKTIISTECDFNEYTLSTVLESMVEDGLIILSEDTIEITEKGFNL